MNHRIFDFHTERRRRHRSALLHALGPVVGPALRDPDVSEVLVNPDGRVWFDTQTHGMVDTDKTLDPADTHRILTTVAGLLKTVISKDQPILEGQMPDGGSRIEGVLPPLSTAPALAIRKPTPRIFPLDEYLGAPRELIEDEAPPPPAVGFGAAIRWALEQRKNLLVVGGTSSAKTSRLNSLFQLLLDLGHPRERFFVIEDTFELQCPARNRVQLQTTSDITLSDLVRVALRMRPDRIIVGEVRGPEALPMLRAWNTGHEGGMCTVHANSALEGLFRLEELIEEGGAVAQPQRIARTLDLVIFLKRVDAKRRVIREMLHVLGHDGDAYRVRPVEHQNGGDSPLAPC